MDILTLLASPPTEVTKQQYQSYAIDSLLSGQVPEKMLRGATDHLRQFRQAISDPKFMPKYWDTIRNLSMSFAAEVATGTIYDDCLDSNGNLIRWKQVAKDNILNNQKWLFGRLEARLQQSNNIAVTTDEVKRLPILTPITKVKDVAP